MNDSGKVGAYSAPGQGITADGGLDSNAQIVLDVPTTTYYTRAIGEQNLTVFERENLGKPVPYDADVTGAVGVRSDALSGWTYDEGLSNRSILASAGPNATYADQSQSDTRRDFSKGHGAAPPTQLAPECSHVGSASVTANPPKNPDNKSSNTGAHSL